MSDSDYKYADFEREGEAAVRENIDLKRYRAETEALAKEWLWHRDHQPLSRKAGRLRTAQNPQEDYVRSAKSAAWVAAISAVVAAISAFIAVFYR